MDTTLSAGPVSSTLKILHPKSHQLHHHFKNHFPQHLQSHLILSSTSRPKASNKATAFTNNNNTHNNFITNPPFVNSSSSSRAPKKSPPGLIHRKPSTGYAVALLDAARSRHNLLEAVQRDVRRLSKWLSNDQLRRVIASPYVDKKEKGEILREIMDKGEFHKQLRKLVNMLVDKNKLEMLKEVLMEFGRIYSELIIGSSNSTSQVVLVPSGLKMEVNQVLGIAQRVQKITGAAKVMVRQLVDDERLMP